MGYILEAMMEFVFYKLITVFVKIGENKMLLHQLK